METHTESNITIVYRAFIFFYEDMQLIQRGIGYIFVDIQAMLTEQEPGLLLCDAQLDHFECWRLVQVHETHRLECWMKGNRDFFSDCRRYWDDFREIVEAAWKGVK